MLRNCVWQACCPC